MKKSITAVLLILLALLFVSCDNDKSEEVIATYEKFCQTYVMMAPVTGLFPETTGSLANKEIKSENMKAFLSALHPGKIIEVTTEKPAFTKGTITITNDESSKKKTAVVSSDPDAQFSISYKLTKDKETEQKTNEQHFISLSSSMEDNDSVTTVSYSLTLDDKVYGSITYSHDGEKFTSATVDGKSVDLRLLNAARLDPTPTVKSDKTETTENVTSTNTTSDTSNNSNT